MNPFSKKARSYDKHSFIQKEVNNRLLRRLDLIKHDKLNVLEIQKDFLREFACILSMI